MNGLKNRLDGAKGRWAEELPNVLWVYQTTPIRSTGETSFSLTYGAKAVILAEINLCNAQVSKFVPAQNDGLMVEHLDLLEEIEKWRPYGVGDLMSTKAYPMLQPRCEDMGIRCWGPNVVKGSRKYARYEC